MITAFTVITHTPHKWSVK